jgi:hypothetical protein
VFNKIIQFTLLSIFLVGCTHSVHLVHVGDFKPFQKLTSGRTIEALAEQWVFLGFTLETDYVNIARENLIKQCNDGSVQGPVTRLSTSHGFFFVDK